MKSILVAVGGSESDHPVFETAHAAARLFSAHLRFLHLRISLGEAAVNTPHMAFASGPGLGNALDRLQEDSDRRSAGALAHVRQFCARESVELRNPVADAVTASWSEETYDAAGRLMFFARHSDLVVAGRAARPNGLPPDFIETLVAGCGRPVLIAPGVAPHDLVGTVMVCWRETPDVARAMGAAMPFLRRAERVVFVSVEEAEDDIAPALKDVSEQFGQRGIRTEAKILPAKGPTADVLAGAAHACNADLIVMGAYGHSRLRETIFGGCTQSFIRHADRPVLLLH